MARQVRSAAALGTFRSHILLVVMLADGSTIPVEQLQRGNQVRAGIDGRKSARVRHLI